MGSKYRPGFLPNYRYLPVDIYGEERGSQAETELYNWYGWFETRSGRREGFRYRRGKDFLPWMTSNGITWKAEENRIVRNIISSQREGLGMASLDYYSIWN